MIHSTICFSKEELTKVRNYASHSFRISAATTAVATAGIPGWFTKTFRRWSSNAYLAYIQCPSTILLAVPHVVSGVELLISHLVILIHVNSDHMVIYNSQSSTLDKSYV